MKVKAGLENFCSLLSTLPVLNNFNQNQSTSKYYTITLQMSETVSVSSNSSSSTKNNDSLKIIVLGDSAVGKSKLLERFLLNN